jgi:hypothetical protein
MGRIRTIKPEVARHRLLFELEKELGANVRFAWALLPTQCCREGRFKWRPWDIKLDILPYDDCDFSRVLDAWVTRGMVVKYRVGDEWYGWIPTWRKHQAVNNRETDSTLPSVDDADEVIDYRNQKPALASVTRLSRVVDASRTREARDTRGREGEGKGEGREKEGEGKESPERPVDSVDNSAPVQPKTGEFFPEDDPPEDPQSRKLVNGERRNGDFERINNDVEKLIREAGFSADNPAQLARSLHVSTSQVEVALKQLRDRGRLPTGSAA